jgi:hypothetical protein
LITGLFINRCFQNKKSTREGAFFILVLLL